MKHVADTEAHWRYQVLRYFNTEGKMFRTKLKELHSTQDEFTSHNELSLTFKDYFKTSGMQRIGAIVMVENFPSFFHKKYEKLEMRHFYGIKLVNERFANTFKIDPTEYQPFVNELLNSEPDLVGTKKDFEMYREEMKERDDMNMYWNSEKRESTLHLE